MTVEQGAEFLNKLSVLINDTDHEVIMQAKENVHVRSRRTNDNDEPAAIWVLLEQLVDLCLSLKVI